LKDRIGGQADRIGIPYGVNPAPGQIGERVQVRLLGQHLGLEPNVDALTVRDFLL